MMIIFGVRNVLLKRSWALRGELLVFVALFWWVPAYYELLSLIEKEKAGLLKGNPPS